MARPDAATIHGAVLGAILLGYVIFTWDAWFPERVEPLNFDRLGAVFLLIGVTGYAGVTTVAALLLRRRPLAVLLVHVLALAGCAAALWAEDADRREFDAAMAREQEAALQRARDVRQAEQCVRIADFVVRPRPTLAADVTVSNGCPFRVVVSRVDLTGTDRGGTDVHLDYTNDTPAALAPGARAVRTVTEFIPEAARSDGAGWSWRAVLVLGEPGPAEVCLVSDNAAGKARCGPLPTPRWQAPG